MKIVYRLIISSSICLIAAEAKAQDDTLRVLFIGNSYTYVNDLPNLFANLAESGNHHVATDMSAPGGYTLEQHSLDSATLAKIEEANWNYVILQEQSQYPVIDFYRYGSMYPSARILDSLITARGSRTAFYMTWGRKYGGVQIINGHSSPDFRDFFQMQDSLGSAYSQITNELAAVLSPVGNAWAMARQIDTTIQFWQSDNSHPTVAGSYLAACVFYTTLFHESPLGLSYYGGLESDLALFLQQVAERTVMSVNNQIQPILFELNQNYPNPFNGDTMIKYNLTEESKVVLRIYDILGRAIRTLVDSKQESGPQAIIWNGIDDNNQRICSGAYIYQIVAGNIVLSKRMIYVK
jgi:hypothetical protein